MSSNNIKDLVIVGGGPSALTAAIYTTREDIDTTIYEKEVVGGLAAITDKIDNYPGFPDGIEGMKLAGQLQQQAERFGAHVDFGDVSKLQKTDNSIELTVDGQLVHAKAVLIATGSSYRKVGVPGETEFYGRGVHYCATCDGALYRDRKLVVIGGGNSAFQETLFLTRFSKDIHVIIRSDIRASDVLQHEMQQYIDQGIVTLHTNTTTEEILAEDRKVTGVRVNESGSETVIPTDGVFVFIGLDPNTNFLAGSGVALDEAGMVIADDKLATNVSGVFVSGDVRSGATMQVASAVGDGAVAALSIREYLDQ